MLYLSRIQSCHRGQEAVESPTNIREHPLWRRAIDLAKLAMGVYQSSYRYW